MSAEVAEAIRQTRRTLAEKTWVPWPPTEGTRETCVMNAVPRRRGMDRLRVWDSFARVVEYGSIAKWNDRQTDVGAVLGMTLQALIAELCKPTLAPRTTEA